MWLRMICNMCSFHIIRVIMSMQCNVVPYELLPLQDGRYVSSHVDSKCSPLFGTPKYMDSYADSIYDKIHSYSTWQLVKITVTIRCLLMYQVNYMPSPKLPLSGINVVVQMHWMIPPGLPTKIKTSAIWHSIPLIVSLVWILRQTGIEKHLYFPYLSYIAETVGLDWIP